MGNALHLRLRHRIHEQASRALVVNVEVDDEGAQPCQAELTGNVERDRSLAYAALPAADCEDLLTASSFIEGDSGKAWFESRGHGLPAFPRGARYRPRA